jgi:hypothetical protein
VILSRRWAALGTAGRLVGHTVIHKATIRDSSSTRPTSSLWVRHFEAIEELRQALLEFRETYNTK